MSLTKMQVDEVIDRFGGYYSPALIGNVLARLYELVGAEKLGVLNRKLPDNAVIKLLELWGTDPTESIQEISFQISWNQEVARPSRAASLFEFLVSTFLPIR